MVNGFSSNPKIGAASGMGSKIGSLAQFLSNLVKFAMSFEMIIFILHVVPFIVVLKFSICIHS